MERLGARAIAGIIGAVLLVGLVLFAVNSCASSKTNDKRAEVSTRQGQASVNAGAVAVNKVGQVATSDAASDAAVAGAQAAVHAAPDGLKGAVTKQEACKLAIYRDTPQCRKEATQ